MQTLEVNDGNVGFKHGTSVSRVETLEVLVVSCLPWNPIFTVQQYVVLVLKFVKELVDNAPPIYEKLAVDKVISAEN